MITDNNAAQFTEQDKHKILREMVRTSDRGWFKEGLVNIPGRTRIYKDFAWTWNIQQNSEMEPTRVQHINTILQHTDIQFWIDHYLRHHTISRYTVILDTVLGWRDSGNQIILKVLAGD